MGQSLSTKLVDGVGRDASGQETILQDGVKTAKAQEETSAQRAALLDPTKDQLVRVSLVVRSHTACCIERQVGEQSSADGGKHGTYLRPPVPAPHSRNHMHNQSRWHSALV